MIESLLGTKLPDLEGEAVGFLLFGKNLSELREWWDTAVRAERMERFLEASQQYNLIAARVLAEDYLTRQKRIAVWLPLTKDGNFQTQGAVWSLLDRARKRVGPSQQGASRHGSRGTARARAAVPSAKLAGWLRSTPRGHRELRNPCSEAVLQAPHNGGETQALL